MENQRSIATYIILFIVLVAVIYLLLPKQSALPGGASSSSTLSTSIGVPTSVAVVTTQPYSNKCQVSTLAGLENGYFANGTYSGWNVTGIGFGTAPMNITRANSERNYYSQPWNASGTGFMATTYTGGTNVLSGNLTSDPFTASLPYLNFQLVSPDNNLIYVEVLQDGVPRIITHFNTYAVQHSGNSSSTLVNASVSLIPLLCQSVQVRVVSEAVGTSQSQFDYVAATGFYQSAREQLTPGIVVNQTVNVT